MKKENILKFILTMAVCAVSLSNASAQVGIRADVGIDALSSIYQNPTTITPSFGAGARLGADYDIHLKGRFYISPGLYWSYRSAYSDLIDVKGLSSNQGAHVTSDIQEHSLNLPVHAKWKFNINPDKFGMYVFLGPTFSCGLSSGLNMDMMLSLTEVGWNYSNSKMMRVEGRYDNYTGVYSFESNWDSISSDKLDAIVKDTLDELGFRYNRFEAHFEFGAGFVFRNHYELAVGCDLGITDKIKGEVGKNASELWQSVYVGFRYRF